MTDQQQITDAFMSDFKELLRRYNAVFDLCSEDCDTHADIDFNLIYDENHNMVRPYINFQLPNYINPDS
jgi:hypothetical protein